VYLWVGGWQGDVAKAAALVKEFVDRLAAQRVVISVSAFAIPSIIGSGGSVIKGLRVRAMRWLSL
jgi:hypothetical protein